MSFIGDTAPSVIVRDNNNKSVLSKIFAYRADRYDLDKYESHVPGAKGKIWEMIQTESSFQAEPMPLISERHNHELRMQTLRSALKDYSANLYSKNIYNATRLLPCDP